MPRAKTYRVTLQNLEGISSITVVAEDGRSLELKKGQPAILKDPNRGLMATIERLPVDVVPEDDDGA